MFILEILKTQKSIKKIRINFNFVSKENTDLFLILYYNNLTITYNISSMELLLRVDFF